MSETLKADRGRIDAEELELDSLPLLSAEECERACRSVFELREQWTPRAGERPFHTLGAASYLDASHGRFQEYRQKAQDANPALARHFGWLHARLRERLGGYAGGTCLFDERLALPGFHIFLGEGDSGAAASRHYDLQADNLDWSGYRWMDRSRQLSFTLAVRLPASGSGLYVWNVNDERLQRLSPAERKRHLEANQRPRYVDYQPGHLLVHSGHYLHQIARIRQMGPGDERLTLQGHATPTDRGWVVYW